MLALRAAARSMHPADTFLPALAGLTSPSLVSLVLPSFALPRPGLPSPAGGRIFPWPRALLLPVGFQHPAKWQGAGILSGLPAGALPPWKLEDARGLNCATWQSAAAFVSAAVAIGVSVGSINLPPEDPKKNKKNKQGDDPEKKKGKRVLSASEKQRYLQLLNELKKNLSSLPSTKEISDLLELINKVIPAAEAGDELALLLELDRNMETLLANAMPKPLPFAVEVKHILGFDLVYWVVFLNAMVWEMVSFVQGKLMTLIGLVACVSNKVYPPEAVSILQMVFEDTIKAKREKIRKLQAKNAGSPVPETSLEDLLAGQQELKEMISSFK